MYGCGGLKPSSLYSSCLVTGLSNCARQKCVAGGQDPLASNCTSNPIKLGTLVLMECEANSNSTYHPFAPHGLADSLPLRSMAFAVWCFFMFIIVAAVPWNCVTLPPGTPCLTPNESFARDLRKFLAFLGLCGAVFVVRYGFGVSLSPGSFLLRACCLRKCPSLHARAIWCSRVAT